MSTFRPVHSTQLCLTTLQHEGNDYKKHITYLVEDLGSTSAGSSFRALATAGWAWTSLIQRAMLLRDLAFATDWYLFDPGNEVFSLWMSKINMDKVTSTLQSIYEMYLIFIYITFSYGWSAGILYFPITQV